MPGPTRVPPKAGNDLELMIAWKRFLLERSRQALEPLDLRPCCRASARARRVTGDEPRAAYSRRSKPVRSQQLFERAALARDSTQPDRRADGEDLVFPHEDDSRQRGNTRPDLARLRADSRQQQRNRRRRGVQTVRCHELRAAASSTLATAAVAREGARSCR